ncbi:MAG: hypothetical protein AAF206_07315 [Bacteroidota bacterium]
MKRRDFLRASSLTAAATIAAPYILPSGRLFARSMQRRVNHVVFCLFAGGIRNLESVHQNEGNLMPAMLAGTDASIPGLDPLPASPWSNRLEAEGTLFKEFRYKEGPTGHFNGHTVALTGVYTNTGLNLAANPEAPTVFEYYLKHNSPAVTSRNAWWVSNALGPYPALNYSQHPSYGPQYGANHITPTSLISQATYPVIGNPKQFQFHEEEAVKGMRSFLNRQFGKQPPTGSIGNVNSEADAEAVRVFINDMYTQGLAGAFNNPLGVSTNIATNDIFTILFAEEVIKRFTPELLVVNMTDVDACHQNFTAYCNNLRKADYALAHLWNTIQNTPGMADDTVLILAPEHGRNLQPNTVSDIHGRLGVDHTGDPTSREIFAMVLGPSSVVNKGLSVGTAQQPIGESIDLVPTVANLLGFDVNIPPGFLPGRVLNEALA